jgi:hypothetical protein
VAIAEVVLSGRQGPFPMIRPQIVFTR